PGRKLYFKFFNKSRYVVVRYHFALPFLDSENFIVNTDFQIVFHLYLAGKSYMLFLLCTAKMASFGRQYIASSLFYHTFAHGTGTPSATSRRKKNFLIGQGGQQARTSSYS